VAVPLVRVQPVRPISIDRGCHLWLDEVMKAGELMAKRLPVVLGILLVAAVGWASWQALRQPREPVYRGKPLSSWLKAYENPVTPEVEAQADAAVRQAGTNAIPILVRLLRVEDSALKVKFMDLVQRQHIIRIEFTRGPVQHRPRTIEIEYTSAVQRNWAGSRGFTVLGTNGQSATPALIEIANRNISLPSRYYAIEALGYIGPPAKDAVPSLLRLATNADLHGRCSAMFALRQIHEKPDQVLPLLTNALHSPYAIVRLNAILGLQQIGPEAANLLASMESVTKPAVPALIGALQRDTSATYRREVAEALGELGKGDSAAITALTGSLKDTDGNVRVAATNALKKIDPAAAAKAGVNPSSPL
jgi:HEAT repeat protein